jgi:predicted RNA-binding protein YlqC (UPF0109 family)
MKEFIEFIAKYLVDYPDSVQVDMEERDDKTVLKLRVAEGDVGKIIGRKGRTAQALRTLLNAVAAKERKHAILEVLD